MDKQSVLQERHQQLAVSDQEEIAQVYLLIAET